MNRSRPHARTLARAWLSIALLAAGTLAVQTPPARAHPGPAVPPEFLVQECITVVDKREQDALVMPYGIAYEDVEYDVGEIKLDDAKSHQFFAWRGSFASLVDGLALFPFDPELEDALGMPLWISQDDVERAAAAVTEDDATGFRATDVVASDVLDNRSELAPYFLELSPDSERVPIVSAYANQGARWDVREVPVGVYTVAAYVFGPPYNDWALRSGVVKVIDGDDQPPALSVGSIDGSVFAGQGRRVTGCVSAPPGSTLSAWFRTEDVPDASFEPWLTEQAIDGDDFELCLLPPQGLSGLLRVRIEVRAPDGSATAAYSPDTVLALDTEATCKEGKTICCPSDPSAGMTNTDADAGASSTARDGGANDGVDERDAAVATNDTPDARDDASNGDQDASQAALEDEERPGVGGDSSGGCSAASGRSTGSWLLLWTLVLLRSRARRIHRAGVSAGARAAARMTSTDRPGMRAQPTDEHPARALPVVQEPPSQGLVGGDVRRSAFLARACHRR